jgi:1-acyl-sn-glycerol-3-phosphate acyltransferase
MSQATTEKRKKKRFRDMNPEEQEEAIRNNKPILTRDHDLDFMQSLNEEIVQLLERYFRPVFVGFDELEPRSNPERPLIYACNHSGMAFPWDAIMFASGIYKRHDYDLPNLFRPLAAPALSASHLMNPFMLNNMWRRVGAIDATTLNFETMMRYGKTNVLIYPEGIPGIGKGFNNKYKLQTFSTSMIRMALKYDTEIVGISCVNGEYINPWSFSSKWLNKQINRIGVPYLPIALQTPFLLVQPWLFYYAFPAKLTYVKGKHYNPREMVGGKSWEEITEEDIIRVRDEIQADMQVELDNEVEKWGKKPIDWREHFRYVFKYWRQLPYWTPLGWPALFCEYDRLYRKGKEMATQVTRGWFRFWMIVWKNPMILSYFIPILGWIPILYQGLRGRKEVEAWEGPKA